MSMSVSEELASETVDLMELSSPLDKISEDIVVIFSGIRDAEVDVKLFGSCPAEHRSFFYQSEGWSMFVGWSISPFHDAETPHHQQHHDCAFCSWKKT